MLCVSLTLRAIPAQRKPFAAVLDDGTSVTAMLCGDEVYHYYQTVDGRLLDLLDDGTFRVLPSLAADEQFLLRQAASRRAADDSRRAQRAGERRNARGHYGNRRGLVILVDFSDQPFVHSTQEIWDMFNKPDYHKDGHLGSVRDYFIDQSYGKFAIDFDVVGPYTASREWTYYGKNDPGGSDLRPGKLIAEACLLADADVDYSRYDWDGDGEVEQIYVIYSGYAESNGAPKAAIWPHEWNLHSNDYGQKLSLDGVEVDTYACSSELDGNSGTLLDGIGTACHEFSHCLGFRDLYDTNGRNFGLDRWSVMDYGCYNGGKAIPCGFTSYERWQAGWLEPVELTDPCVVSGMKALTAAPEAYVIYNDAHRDEYYLLENRQQQRWDKAGYGHGLLVIHVDYERSAWNSRLINYYADHRRLTIIPADGQYSSQSYAQYKASQSDLAGDPYPGSQHNTSLTSTSTPAATLYNPNPYDRLFMDKPLENISEQGGTISFTFMGGDPTVLRAPTAISATDVSTTGFTAHWLPVSSAVSYTVEGSAGIIKRVIEGVTEPQAVVSGLTTARTPWHFRVKAVNAAGEASEWSNTVTVTPPDDAAWTAWQPFASGVCDYTYNLKSIWGSNDTNELPICYRQSIADPQQAQLLIKDWGYQADLIVDWDKATGHCRVDQQFTGAVDNVQGGGKLYVADEVYYRTQRLGRTGITYADYPSSFDAQSGILTLYLVYYDLKSTAYAWGEGVEVAHVIGREFTDYSIAVRLGALTEQGGRQAQQSFSLQVGADVASCRYGVVEGDLITTGITDRLIEAVTDGTIATTQTGTFIEPVSVSVTPGTWSLVAVTYDAGGQPQQSTYVVFTYVNASDWQPIGLARYTDDVIASPYELDPVTYDVEVERNLYIPGLYRMKNAYGAAYPYQSRGTVLGGDYYIEINATDPQRVYIPYQPTGLDMGTGPIYIYSMASYTMDNGGTLDDAYRQGLCGTLKDGVITFPVQAMLIAIGQKAYYGNTNGAFRLDLTTCGLTPLPAAADDANSPSSILHSPFFDLQGRPVTTPSVGALYIHNGRKILVK